MLDYQILETLVRIPSDKSWHLELNLMKWGNNPPKYDLRSWSDDHSKMGKGATLTKEELQLLKDELSKIEL